MVVNFHGCERENTNLEPGWPGINTPGPYIINYSIHSVDSLVNYNEISDSNL